MQRILLLHVVSNLINLTYDCSLYLLLGGSSQIVKKSAMQDDPQKRKPDITLAKSELNWSPKVGPMKIEI